MPESTLLILVAALLRGVVCDVTLTLTDTTDAVTWFYPIEAVKLQNVSYTCKVEGFGVAQEHFEIFPGTCLLTLIKPLTDDAQATSQYNVLVVATSSNATEVIQVIANVPRNLFPPVFQSNSYSQTISEKFPTFTPLVTVQATDADSQPVQEITYSIKQRPGSSDDIFFRINSTSGAIYIRQTLENMDQATYEFLVEADDGVYTATASVVVQVPRPTNDAPIFESHQTSIRVPEYIPVRETVVTLKATDSNRLTYDITNVVPPEGAGYYIISRSSGAITVDIVLSTPACPSIIMLTVTAVDDARDPKNATTNVTVVIIRNQYAPVFNTGEFSASIDEHDDVGTVIGTVTATDADRTLQAHTPNAEVQYSVVETTYFDVSSDGSVYISKPLVGLQTDDNNTTAFQLRASDKSWQPRNSDIMATVTVRRRIQATPAIGFVQPQFYVEVREQMPSFRYNLRVANHGGRDFICSIVFGSEKMPGFFSLKADEVGCILETRHPFDREITDSYDLGIQVDFYQRRVKRNTNPVNSTCASNTWKTTQVIIRVFDDNDNIPRFIYPAVPGDYIPNEYYFVDSLDSKPGKLVGRVTANDLDFGQNGHVSYFIDTFPTVPPPFYLSPNTGDLIVSQEFDPSPGPRQMFRFWVYARDSSITSPPLDARTPVTVFVAQNIHKFVLVLSNISSSDVFPREEEIRRQLQNVLGFLVLIEGMEAKRTEIGNRQMMSLESTDVIFSMVRKDTNVPVLITHQDHFFSRGILNKTMQESVKTLFQTSLKLQVERLRLPFTTSSTGTTSPQTNNTSGPRFAPNHVTTTIQSSKEPHTPIMTVKATDDDGDKVHHGILPFPPDSYYFHIDPFTGVLSLSIPIDRDVKPSYKLRIVAVDDGTPLRSDTATVEVFVHRNGNSPVFTMTVENVNISEYTPVMEEVARATAVDYDMPNTLDGQLRFFISSVVPNNDQDYFIISPVTGGIQLARPLTGNSVPNTFVLELFVTDLSSTPKNHSTNFTINVIRNMYAPVFTHPNIHVTMDMDENTVGKVIARVNATDADQQVELNKQTGNSEVSYQIQSGSSAADYFGITKTGDIILQQPLDASEFGLTTIKLYVQAHDLSWSPMRAFITVNVFVNFTSWIDPGFTQPIFRVEVYENKPRGDILFLNVTSGDDVTVTCFITHLDGERDGMFQIRSDEFQKNCVLVNMMGLDHELSSVIHLTVGVSSRGRPRSTAGAHRCSTWSEAEVYIYVKDRNDHRPIFFYPIIPQGGYDYDIYHGLVSSSVTPGQRVLKVHAKDRDSGPFANVSYKAYPEQSVPEEFFVSEKDGEITTTVEFGQTVSGTQWRFLVGAYDGPSDQNPRIAKTEVLIHLVDDVNRLILIIGNSTSEVVHLKEDLRRVMQDKYGYLVLIETVQAKRELIHQTVEIDFASTDVVLVLVDEGPQSSQPPYRHHNKLLNNTDPVKMKVLMSSTYTARLKAAVSDELDLNITGFRLPHSLPPAVQVPQVTCIPDDGVSGTCKHQVLAIVVVLIALLTPCCTLSLSIV